MNISSSSFFTSVLSVLGNVLPRYTIQNSWVRRRYQFWL